MVELAKTVALPPKGHAPTAEHISLLDSADVCIAEEGGVTVVGIPIGTKEHVLERLMGEVEDGGADRLAHCLVNMPEKKRRPSSPLNSSDGGRVTFKGLWKRGCPSKHAGRQTRGRSGPTRNH